MEKLRKDDFDQIIRTGDDIIIFCYKDNDAESLLGMKAFDTVDQMIGKSFRTYIVNIINEPEIITALGATDRAEFFCIKNKKIYNKKNGVFYSNEILDMLK